MYMAYLMKKKGLFGPSYTIEGDKIYVTDTKRAKKKFLKSGMRHVFFGEEFAYDAPFASLLVPAKKYDREFLKSFLEGMIDSVTEFFSQKLPYDEIVVFSQDEKIHSLALKYARLVSVVGEGEGRDEDGSQLRFIKKVKMPPSLVITEGEGDLSPVFRVPRINLGENVQKSIMTLAKDTLSFSTSLFPFDIDAETVCYFLQKGEKFEYKISSYRKKSPQLFTFG